VFDSWYTINPRYSAHRSVSIEIPYRTTFRFTAMNCGEQTVALYQGLALYRDYRFRLINSYFKVNISHRRGLISHTVGIQTKLQRRSTWI